MSLQETLAQIAALQRTIENQQRLINDFIRENRERIQLVRTELHGSTKGYDQRMLSELTQTETSLNNSLASLQRAGTALSRVRSI